MDPTISPPDAISIELDWLTVSGKLTKSDRSVIRRHRYIIDDVLIAGPDADEAIFDDPSLFPRLHRVYLEKTGDCSRFLKALAPYRHVSFLEIGQEVPLDEASVTAIHAMTGLKELRIKCPLLRPTEFAAAIPANIRSLSIKNSNMGDQDDLLEKLGTKDLTSLEVAGINFREPHFRSIVRFSKLHKLQLERCHLAEADFQQLVHLDLHELWLRENTIASDNQKEGENRTSNEILETIGSFKSLRNLMVKSGALDKSGLHALCDLPNLKALTLNAPGLNDGALDILGGCHTLQELTVPDRRFSQSALEDFRSRVPRCRIMNGELLLVK
jgi:hypothetical protein